MAPLFFPVSFFASGGTLTLLIISPETDVPDAHIFQTQKHQFDPSVSRLGEIVVLAVLYYGGEV